MTSSGLKKSEMPKAVRIKSDNGDLFLVRKEGKDVAIGLVARGRKKGIKLAYFFVLDHLKSLSRLRPQDAFFIIKITDVSIADGEWPLLGRLEGFSESDWPMPVFERFPETTNWRIVSTKDEVDLANETGSWHYAQVPPHIDLSFIIPDGLANPSWIEDVLLKVLAGKRPEVTYRRKSGLN
jgi:hypothetical protein